MTKRTTASWIISLMTLTVLIGSGCMMDPEVDSTNDQELVAELDDQEVTAEPLASGSDEVDTAASDEIDPEAGTATHGTGLGTESVADFARCMYFEVGFRITQNCVDVCNACVTGNPFTRPVNCGLCATCAGVNGVQAALYCKQFL